MRSFFIATLFGLLAYANSADGAETSTDSTATIDWIYDKMKRFRSAPSWRLTRCDLQTTGLPGGDIEDNVKIAGEDLRRMGRSLSLKVDFSKVEPATIKTGCSGLACAVRNTGGVTVEISSNLGAFELWKDMDRRRFNGTVSIAFDGLTSEARDGEKPWRARLLSAFKQLATECNPGRPDDSRFD